MRNTQNQRRDLTSGPEHHTHTPPPTHPTPPLRCLFSQPAPDLLAELPVPQVLRDILKEVQSNMVPRSMLKEWALHTFPNATDYWTFRKMFTIQLALIGFAEFVLHLNRLNPEMLQIAQVTWWARPGPPLSLRLLLLPLSVCLRPPGHGQAERGLLPL